MLAAMAFVPAPDVDDAFAELARNVPEELLPILDFFEDTYLGAVRRGIRRAPCFPATMWSIYDRVTAELPRTNNAIEGWHSALGANAGGHHINLWRFIGILQREEVLGGGGKCPGGKCPRGKCPGGNAPGGKDQGGKVLESMLP